MPKRIDKTGKRYGRWLVVGFAEYKQRKAFWRCRCKCGNEKDVPAQALTDGESKSCGCLHRDIVRKTRTHGECRDGRASKNYRQWRDMIRRCESRSRADYHLYGGRGIKVCGRWRNKNGFINFTSDMGKRPKGYSIDRIDVNGDYCPENCRWASSATQNNNRRDNVTFVFEGKTLSTKDLCKRLNTNLNTIHSRINRGWTIRKMIEQPVRIRSK